MTDIIDINSRKKDDEIILTNGQVFNFCNEGFPEGKAFLKLQRNCGYAIGAGKILYWLTKFYKEFTYILKDIEKTRIELLGKFCKRNEKNEPILEYQFTSEKRKLYNEEVLQIENPSIEDKRKIAEKYCIRDQRGMPLSSYTFEEGQIEKYSQEFNKTMEQLNILKFKRIVINSDLLEKINTASKEPLSAIDMINLEPIIEFVE